MAKKETNDCVGCPTCICCGRRKPYYIYFCDDCGREDDDLYEFEGEQLCRDCVLRRIPKVDQEA